METTIHAVLSAYLGEGGSEIQSLLLSNLSFHIAFFLSFLERVVYSVFTSFFSLFDFMMISAIAAFAVLVLFMPFAILLDAMYCRFSDWFYSHN